VTIATLHRLIHLILKFCWLAGLFAIHMTSTPHQLFSMNMDILVQAHGVLDNHCNGTHHVVLGSCGLKEKMRKWSIWNIMTDSWYQEDLLRRYQRDKYYNGSTEQNCSQHHEHNTHFSLFLFKMRQIRRRDFNHTFMRSNSICCGFNIKSNSWCNNIWRAFESV